MDGQVAGLEVGVQLEPDFVRFDQRRGARPGGEGSRREEDQEQRERSPQSFVVAWRGEQRLQEAAVDEGDAAVDLQPAAGAFGFDVADFPAAPLEGAPEGRFGEDRDAVPAGDRRQLRFRCGSRSGRG